MNAVGTVSFDLDGTLAVGPLGGVLRDVSAVVAAGDCVRATRLQRELFACHRAMLRGGDVGAYDWVGIARQVFGDATGGIADSIPERCRVALEAGGGSRLIHGTSVAGLRRLRDASWRLVVATNGRSEYQVPVLRTLGLLGCFDRVVTSDRAGAVKPDPAFFRDVGCAAAPWLHVGDRLDHDVVGAAAAGASPVLLRPDAPWVGRAADARGARRAVAADVVADYCASLRAAEGADGQPCGGVGARRREDVGCAALDTAWVAHDFDEVVAHVLAL